MTKKDMIDAIWRLYYSGWPTHKIAYQLHVSEHFVVSVVNKR